jgi:hypothetical protein
LIMLVYSSMIEPFTRGAPRLTEITFQSEILTLLKQILSGSQAILAIFIFYKSLS